MVAWNRKPERIRALCRTTAVPEVRACGTGRQGLGTYPVSLSESIAQLHAVIQILDDRVAGPARAWVEYAERLMGYFQTINDEIEAAAGLFPEIMDGTSDAKGIIATVNQNEPNQSLRLVAVMIDVMNEQAGVLETIRENVRQEVEGASLGVRGSHGSAIEHLITPAASAIDTLEQVIARWMQ
jgi:hypothetical protein